jgi:hypothetical protein
MLEYLRLRRRTPSLVLQCFRCGVTRQIEDDGRRVHHAQVHQNACPEAPTAAAEPRLRLVSSDHLEVQMADGSIWFELRRKAGS